ncbi:MAG: S-layer homology domain-containing protein [Deltaproteobacteria bacterium]|nr:S-layer homology domain-containing protein [Deltaproteobacteria bacterium]
MAHLARSFVGLLSCSLVIGASASCESPPSDDAAVVQQRASSCEHPVGSGTAIAADRKGLGTGVVSSTPAGLSCAPPCSGSVSGASATLTATAAPGSRFAGWTRDCLASGASACVLPLSGQARNATPIFTKLATSGQIYDDVPLGRADAAYVNLLQEKAITDGTSVTPPRFSPDAPLTRGQMAVFIVRAKNLALPNPAGGLRGGSPDNFDAPDTPYFSDVPRDHIFFKHVQKLRELGITTGYPDGRYGPDDPIPQWQMSVFLTRAFYGEAFTSPASPYFGDVPSSHLAFKYAQKSAEDGVECGCGGGTLCADATITRGRMATQITRRFFGAPRCNVAPAPAPPAAPVPAGPVCGNGVCEAGENGGNCGQDCCDSQTACGQTYRNQGLRYCRDLRVGYQWRGYQWVTEQDTGLVCDQAADAQSANLALCGGQAFVCCWPNGTWTSGLACP